MTTIDYETSCQFEGSLVDEPVAYNPLSLFNKEVGLNYGFKFKIRIQHHIKAKTIFDGVDSIRLYGKKGLRMWKGFAFLDHLHSHYNTILLHHDKEKYQKCFKKNSKSLCGKCRHAMEARKETKCLEDTAQIEEIKRIVDGDMPNEMLIQPYQRYIPPIKVTPKPRFSLSFRKISWGTLKMQVMSIMHS